MPSTHGAPPLSPTAQPDPLRRAIWAVPVLLAASVAVIFTDELAWGGGFARALRDATHDGPLDFLEEFIDLGEMFGSKPGLVLIPLAILLMDPRRWERLGMMLRGLLAQLAMVQPAKVLFGRARPPFDRRNEFVIPADEPHVGEWFGPDADPWGAHRLDTDWLSYPSGHSALAVLLACMLTHFYPRGAAIWWLLGGLCILQRMVNAQHFPSDGLAGAGIGLLAFWLARPAGPLGRAWTHFRPRKVAA
jgi:membrane-associated phospholipid phosphatase